MFRERDAAERGAGADADVGSGERVAAVEQCHLRGDERKLGEAVEAFDPVRGEPGKRIKLGDFTGNLRTKRRGIESRDAPDAGLIALEAVPQTIFAAADAGERAEAGDDNAVVNETTWLTAGWAEFSRRRLNAASVLVATGSIKWRARTCVANQRAKKLPRGKS